MRDSKPEPKTIVVALGGNAILQPGQTGTAEEQCRNIAHGNGPQVGAILIQQEEGAKAVPAMPVGPFYSEERAKELQASKGWRMKEDAGRGWRRVVPSPDPKRILEAPVIRAVVASGAVAPSSTRTWPPRDQLSPARPGSMGPKIEAALRFVEGGGETSIIASLTQAAAALAGRSGTRITRAR